MFDLESAISHWRAQLLAAGIETPVPLEELESHLRDEIARLVAGGADQQIAFEAATQIIGGPAMLKNEFSKIQPATRKKFRPILIPMFVSVFGLCVALTILLRLGNFAEMTSAQRLSGLAAVALPLLLSWGGWFGYRVFSSQAVKKARGFIIGSASCLLMLWWTVLFFVVLPRCEFDLAQLNVAIMWGFIASGGFVIGLSAGLERAVRRGADSGNSEPPNPPAPPGDSRKNSHRWLMIMCLLLAASFACLSIRSDADAKSFCVIADLLLSIALPLAVGPPPATGSRGYRRWISMMLAAQISLGLFGAIILFAPLHPLWGLSLAALTCVVFGQKLHGQSLREFAAQAEAS